VRGAIQFVCLALIPTSVGAQGDFYEQALNAAVRALPPEWAFPEDSAHIVLIRDYGAFLRTHPRIRDWPEFRRRGADAVAFSIPGSWPIFVNLDGHKPFFDAYGRPGGGWVVFILAGMLVHEQVHVRGDARESSALLEELLIDRRLRREGKLTSSVNLCELADQYLDALEAERRSGGVPWALSGK